MQTSAEPVPPFGGDGRYLAVELEGSAGDWTASLNELAADGWELMQIVDRRAVLKRA